MAKDINSIFFDITPEIEELALKCETNNAIDKELYTKYEVKRGLRDLNGKGVLAGLTNISDVCATKIVDGVSVPCAGNLYYRGYNIKDLVSGFLEAKHFGFEEIAYLLLFGELPNQKELENFKDMIADRRMLPPNFVRDVIMKAPSRDMMNSITRSILQLYSYDDKADDTSIPNVLRQSLNLISQFPMLMVYSYLAYNYKMGEDLYIYAPKKELSMAENILMMLREDRQYTELEAKILDMALVLHMDHGGGNNSTFTTHVVTSSGTDTYSTIVQSVFHHFNPYGVSGAVIISESHLAIHTWPEYGYAAVDVFTCGDKINPWTAFKYLEEVFKAERSESIEVPRGMVEKIRNFSPKNLGKITFKPETIKEEVC